jgi:hypothetical protein
MRLEQRRSSITSHPDHEPHLAVLPVLAHESLWIDSADIPLQITGEMTPLYNVVDDTFVADLSNENAIFDARGKRVSASYTDGGTGVVRKRVRVTIPAGRFGEFVCVKNIIHENIDVDTAVTYRPLLEEYRSESWELLPDHLWSLDYAAGVIVINSKTVYESLFLTFYEYVGRIGATEAMRNPTTDLIREGEINKFLSRPKVEEWTRDVIASISTDDVQEGDVHLYGSGAANTKALDNDVFQGVTEGHHFGTVTGHVSGTVSSLENHPVIHANIIGNGEGDWLGDVHGNSRGTFSGEANVTGGEMQRLNHVAIGGAATSAPLTIYASDHAHVSLVSSTGISALLSARGDGSLCTESLQVETLRTQQLYSFGVDNAYAGFSRVGNLAGVEHMRAKSVECDRLFATPGILTYYSDECTATKCYIRDASGKIIGKLGRAGFCSSIHIPKMRSSIRIEIVCDDRTVHRDADMTGDECVLEVSNSDLRFESV